MFHARKKLAGYRLVADDVPWAAGQGRQISGPIGALLLLLTGRPAALPQLSGPGADDLRKLLSGSRHYGRSCFCCRQCQSGRRRGIS
jgi:hypothetical protein